MHVCMCVCARARARVCVCACVCVCYVNIGIEIELKLEKLSLNGIFALSLRKIIFFSSRWIFEASFVRRLIEIRCLFIDLSINYQLKY